MSMACDSAECIGQRRRPAGTDDKLSPTGWLASDRGTLGFTTHGPSYPPETAPSIRPFFFSQLLNRWGDRAKGNLQTQRLIIRASLFAGRLYSTRTRTLLVSRGTSKSRLATFIGASEIALACPFHRKRGVSRITPFLSSYRMSEGPSVTVQLLELVTNVRNSHSISPGSVQVVATIRSGRRPLLCNPRQKQMMTTTNEASAKVRKMNFLALIVRVRWLTFRVSDRRGKCGWSAECVSELVPKQGRRKAPAARLHSIVTWHGVSVCKHTRRTHEMS